MTSPVASIPITETDSMTHAFFIEWRQSRLDTRSYHVANAVWVAENTFKYPVTPYNQIAAPLKDYARARALGQRERDGAISFRLGAWVYGVQRAYQENAANMEMLTWCLEKCQDAGMKDRAEVLEHKIAQFHSTHLPEEMPAALEAMKRDARDGQPRAMRGGAA